MRRTLLFVPTLSVALVLVLRGWLPVSTPPAQAVGNDLEAACRTTYDPAKTPGPVTVFKRVGCIAGFLTPASDLTYDRTQLAFIIGDFINIALSFTGVIFVVLVIYGGWLWGTAEGNEEQVTKAKGLIRNAVLGIIVTFGAFAVANFVVLAIGRGLQASALY